MKKWRLLIVLELLLTLLAACGEEEPIPTPIPPPAAETAVVEETVEATEAAPEEKPTLPPPPTMAPAVINAVFADYLLDRCLTGHRHYRAFA